MNPKLRTSTPVHVLLLPHVHVLDMAGPVQALYEANGFGAGYELRYCAETPRVRSAQGLWVSDLEPLPPTAAGDLVLVPGMDSRTLDRLQVPARWLQDAARSGATVASICSGAFALARAGLLDGRACTTHWKVADRLQAEHPAARVHRNRLFVRDAGIVTSAGVASGIDMALDLVERDHGPLLAARVARELVVYLRRDGATGQRSVFLDYRTHMNIGIHKVQDWMVKHPESNPGLSELARVAGMSPRHLTRVFRQATGITLKTFQSRIKTEIAATLLHDPRMTVETVAGECGFRDARQLRRLWRSRFGMSPSTWRTRQERSARC